MTTIKDFKDRMKVGAKVDTKLYWFSKATGEPILQRDYGTREVTIHQSNSFAMATRKIEDGKETDQVSNSWMDWPKKSEFTVIDKDTVKINFGFGYALYTIVNS